MQGDVLRYLKALIDAEATTLPALDLPAVVERMSGGGLDNLTRAQLVAAGGEAEDAYHATLPWSQLAARRDLTATGSGYALVGLTNTPVVDALAPVSAVIGAGATVLSGLKGNVTVPRIATGATAYWLATDGVSEITESQPSIGQITLSPHAVGARVDYSLLLGRQFVGFDAMLRRELLRVIGAIVDVGVLNGSGNSGQPFGVLRTPGIGSASGTSINYATILGMLEDVRDANGTEAGIAWLMSQDVFTLLAARAKVTSGATIIDDGVTLAGKRVVVSQNVPDATLICADWSTILVGTWGVGPELAVDPFGAFRTLGATMRCLLSVDVAVTAPAAVVVASSVT